MSKTPNKLETPSKAVKAKSGVFKKGNNKTNFDSKTTKPS